ncbi:MAG: CbiQ family ECF transporter T component, partial [Pseudomonadota bacterium]
MVNMGQYIPGGSLIHRIDPRVKIGSVMGLSILILKGESTAMGLITAFLIGLLPISHLSIHHVAKALKPMSFFLFLFFILHLFFTHGTPIPPFPPWDVTVTYEGLHKGLMVTWQFALLLLSASILTMTTSPTEIICGIEKILRPFKRIGIPSHDIAIMVSIALRFMPTILQEMDRIKEAEMARGAAFQGGTWGQRLRAIKFLVVSLLLRSLRRGDELATAMEGRGYQRGPRTYMRELRLSRIDYVSMLAMILLTGLCIFFLLGLPSKAFCEAPKNRYLMDRALEAIAMDRGDVGIRTDLSTNPFALSLFTRWMADPLKAPIEAQHIAMALFPIAHRPDLWLSELAKSGDIFSTNPLPLDRYSGHKAPSGLPEELNEAIRCILDAMSLANEKVTGIRKNIPSLERKRIERYLYPEPYTEKDLEKGKEDFFRINTLKEAINATTRIDQKGILEAGMTILKAMTEAKALLTGNGKGYRGIRSFSFMTDLGLVEIGGIGSDVHEKDAILIIDLGGNDLYRGKVASGAEGKCAVVLDLSGDDTYLGEDQTQGSGFWGIGILWDLSGRIGMIYRVLQHRPDPNANTGRHRLR